MELEIMFPLKGTYGQGTALTHAAEVGVDRTLCGKHIAPEWMYDTNWVVDRATLSVHGPECKGCVARAFSMLAADSPAKVARACSSTAPVPDGGR